MTFIYKGHTRIVFYYVPPEPGKAPIVVLLHGSGRDGSEMVNAWKSLAMSEHLVLAAPDSLDTSQWDSQDDTPAFLHQVVDQVKVLHEIDPQRTYLFGHSGGAVYALALALIDSDFYAATAVHAGTLPAGSQHLFTYPDRHMPIAIWVGDRDAAFPVERVSETTALLRLHGFDVKLHVVPNHGHDYEASSETIDREAWEFFKEVQLPVSLPSE